ncbi:hypothetical protein [Chryseobacterium geocarposphaerae]|uniref:hypothetical protein n=1 Tax=Chryseobacterium geocarposphaerae TaxID=1416776 RepID=UPI00286CE8B7|nr:hypothetical protein [Chryseobacterium geocarposphaerae]
MVYYKETDGYPEEKKKILRKQYMWVAGRLWNIIIAPASIIMVLSGIVMLFNNPGLIEMPWFN